MARIKFMSVADLLPPKSKERQPSQRQLAVMKREEAYEKAIARLVPGTGVPQLDAPEGIRTGSPEHETGRRMGLRSRCA
jgi:hypothetical protein